MIRFNIKATAVRSKDWKQINTCCGEVEKFEWTKGKFVYRCNKCFKTKAIEEDGYVMWEVETPILKL